LAISKEKKHQMVGEYADGLARSQTLILADYRGLTVAEITELRRRLREVNSAFRVVKNTLIKLALEQAGIPAPTDLLAGPVAVAYCFGEAPPVAKALMDYAKEVEALQLTGAILETGSWTLPACKRWRISRRARCCWPRCWGRCRRP
jgi:large subunit ribosomal protein L10